MEEFGNVARTHLPSPPRAFRTCPSPVPWCKPGTGLDSMVDSSVF